MEQSFLFWGENLSVHVEKMDQQHKYLIGLINELHSEMAAKPGKADLHSILDGLLHYAEFHFADEEALLLLHHYPALAQQQTEHQNFIESVREFKKNPDKEAAGSELRLDLFLRQWLQHHILQIDMDYGQYLNQLNIY
jgi:hemerythrin